MTIQELLIGAEKGQHFSLILLLDFLLTEKQTITLSDDIKVLDLYLQEKHKAKMNHLLAVYLEKLGGKL